MFGKYRAVFITIRIARFVKLYVENIILVFLVYLNYISAVFVIQILLRIL